MKTRRGSSLWPSTLSGATMVNQYKPGDIVTSSMVRESDFIGVVRAVDPKINKVWVAWGGGAVSQHDPDEIHFEPHQSELVRDRMASRRDKTSSAKVADMVNPTESSIQTDFLSPEMEDLLNLQVGYEFYSAYLYFLAAAWLQSKGLVGFQNWMEKQGHDEIGHGMKVYKYLVDTGSTLELPEIPAPLAGWYSVAEVTRAVLDHEMSVTRKWKTIGNLAKQEDNPATEQMAQWFMTEQVEEEDAAVTLHQKVQMAGDGSGILIIDNDLKDRAPNAIKASVKTASVGERVMNVIAACNCIAKNDRLIAWVKGMDGRKSRRTAANPFSDPQFVGDPAEHGNETPISGGFSIMKNLAEQQRKEMTEEAKADSGQPRMAASLSNCTQGARVEISHGSGVDSGKKGTVVNKNEIKTDGRGIPTNAPGYKPVDWKNEVAVRLDDGTLITMYKNRLRDASSKVSAEVTKAEWEEALQVDRYLLKKMQDDLAKIQGGEKVETLTEEGAKSVIKGLEQTIANKEKLMKKFSASKKTAGYLQEKLPNLYQKAMHTYGNDPLYVAVLDADDMPSLKKAMDTLKSIRGSVALANLQFLLRSVLKEASESRSRQATGEMSLHDIKPGGDHYEWAQQIEKAARRIQKLTKGKLKFREIKPFDVYQGPYASMSDGKLWSGEEEGEFYFDYGWGHEGITGDPELIAAGWLSKSEGVTASLRSRRAMYWCSPTRTFRMTRREVVDNTAVCPKCRQPLDLESFTRSDRMYRCPQCSFKVPRSSVIVTSAADMKSRRAGAGVSHDVLYRRVVGALKEIIRDINEVFPASQLKYHDWAISGTVEGHQVKVYFTSIRASNAEVACLPVLVVDGKTYGGDSLGFDIPKELKGILGSVTASLKSRRGSTLVSMEFDTEEEKKKYEQEHDVRPGTKLTVNKTDQPSGADKPPRRKNDRPPNSWEVALGGKSKPVDAFKRLSDKGQDGWRGLTKQETDDFQEAEKVLGGNNDDDVFAFKKQLDKVKHAWKSGDTDDHMDHNRLNQALDSLESMHKKVIEKSKSRQQATQTKET